MKLDPFSVRICAAKRLSLRTFTNNTLISRTFKGILIVLWVILEQYCNSFDNFMAFWSHI